MGEIVEVEKINIEVQPAVVSIVEQEKFEQYINQIVKEYSGYVATSENITTDRKTRATLNKLKEQLETRRKSIKTDINAPYADFEEWYKKAVSPIEKVIGTIDKGIKDVEAHEKSVRIKVIREKLSEMTAGTEIDPRIFESFVDDWAKAANFNKDFKPKKQLSDSISFVIEQERLKQEEFVENRKSISNFAFGNNISDTPYLRMVDEGRSVSDILVIMTEDITKEKARREAEKQRQEAAEKAEQERQAKLLQQQQDFATAQLEKSFGVAEFEQQKFGGVIPPRDPNDVIEYPTILLPENPVNTDKKAKYRATIEIEFESIEEKNQWKTVMTSNGFEHFKAIKFEKVEAE